MSCILTADIGGTNCRMALFCSSDAQKNGMGDERGTYQTPTCGTAAPLTPEGGQDFFLHRERTVWLPTADMASITDVLDAMERELDVCTREVDALVLAVAGPVPDPMCGATTNASLQLDLRTVPKRLPQGKARIVNDFTAQAYACLTVAGSSARLVLPHRASATAPQKSLTTECPVTDGVRGIIGAGTGCGTATLVKDTAGQWLAIPAEAGHVAFPFVGRDETEFARFAARELGYAFLRPDDVVTGTGLSLLYHFLEGERLPAPEVAARALHDDTPTLRWYARFYARVCRNWALTTWCRGGLYVAGGIAARNPLVVDSPYFAEAFYATPHFADMVRSLPVRLVTDEHAGLWGGAWIGTHLR